MANATAVLFRVKISRDSRAAVRYVAEWTIVRSLDRNRILTQLEGNIVVSNSRLQLLFIP